MAVDEHSELLFRPEKQGGRYLQPSCASQHDRRPGPGMNLQIRIEKPETMNFMIWYRFGPDPVPFIQRSFRLDYAPAADPIFFPHALRDKPPHRGA